MVNIEKLQFEQLSLDGLKTLIQWAREEGWNPGPRDAEAFWQTYPEGFFGYFHEGQLIAGGALVSYNGEFGFMGLFIVHPDYRGHGIGRKLWYQRRDTLLQRLLSNAPIGMDGVVAMQPFYHKGGFEIAFRDNRYEKIGSTYDCHPNISAIQAEDFHEILAYDKACFGFNRQAFLKAWLQIPEKYTFKFKEDGQIKGFAILRQATTGYKIGPLFANNSFIAEELYKSCLNEVPGEAVYFDIPMINESAVQIVKKYEAKYVFECGRMYYGTPPPFNKDRVFGITTFELG